jgi:hypothetical protein
MWLLATLLDWVALESRVYFNREYILLPKFPVPSTMAPMGVTSGSDEIEIMSYRK